MLGLGGALSSSVIKRFAAGVGASYGLAGRCRSGRMVHNAANDEGKKKGNCAKNSLEREGRKQKGNNFGRQGRIRSDSSEGTKHVRSTCGEAFGDCLLQTVLFQDVQTPYGPIDLI